MWGMCGYCDEEFLEWGRNGYYFVMVKVVESFVYQDFGVDLEKVWQMVGGDVGV